MLDDVEDVEVLTDELVLLVEVDLDVLVLIELEVLDVLVLTDVLLLVELVDIDELVLDARFVVVATMSWSLRSTDLSNSVRSS